MANEAQVRILKEQGVKAWNRWRKENPIVGKSLAALSGNDSDPPEKNAGWDVEDRRGMGGGHSADEAYWGLQGLEES